ncbi:MAG: UPF0182 family protein, partial [Gemmatimonadota bacterium]
VVVTANVLKSIYVDFLWFQSVGFEAVYRTRLTAQVFLFLAGAVVAAVVIGGNIVLARRFAPKGHEKSFIANVHPIVIRRTAEALLATIAVLMAVSLGSAAAGSWQTVLSWMNRVPFGQVDPQFGRDIAFFIFDLPAYRFFQAWLIGLVFVSLLASGAIYGLSYSLQQFRSHITRSMHTHLSILGGLCVLLIAVSSYLGIFDLVTNPGGIAYGGMYADINARLPVRYILVATAAFTGLAIIANGLFRPGEFRLPLAAFGLWVVAGIGGGVFSQAIQSLRVEPNELQLEAPYLERHIAATRQAWGLDRIDAVSHPANPIVTPAELDRNPATLDNIRLLDPEPLNPTLNELQALRPLYRFADIDISRYPLGAEGEGSPEADQQVLISARELDLTRVGDRNWTRDRLQLTHGFGAIATPVTEVEEEGLPRLTLRDIPPTAEHSRLELTESGSRIYFGELTGHYVVVNSQEPEFDYPDPVQAGRDIRTYYEHDRGIELSSLFRRLMLAWELGDLNLLISGQVQANSRILMDRQIQQRVRKIAPFLVLDSDPYVFNVDGTLKWMQPAYTVANGYPYSQPAGGDVNYIRNSIQIVTDAGTGDIDFYLTGSEDPVVQTFARIFPELFTPTQDMPDAARQQLRYPPDLFRVQAQHYQRYHVTDPEVFFLGEDFWEIPIQRGGATAQPMDPYYVTMRLPDEEEVEFVLILPFTPRDRENTVAWLAGRSDGEHFGSLRNFRFPSGVLVFGPSQIESRIEQNALISQQLTLWDTAGSEVFRSTLMMVPIGDSFLYVQPVYLQAAGGRMPELRRVIVANGNAVAMEETFEEALAVVTGQRAPTSPEELLITDGVPPGGVQSDIPVPAEISGPPGTGLPGLIQQARESSDATQAELNRLRDLLDRIEEQVLPATAP